MILLLKILAVVAFLLNGWVIYYLLRKTDTLEKRLKKAFLDINSLHNNQSRVVLTIKELYRELRKRDKSLKRQIRTPGSQEEGT